MTLLRVLQVLIVDEDAGHFLEPYDHEYGLLEIFKSAGLPCIERMLKGLMGDAYCITDMEGGLVLGVLSEYKNKRDITIEFESRGSISFDKDVDESGLLVLDDLIQIVASAYQKYIMASSLHIETIHADYAEIKEKNRLLQISEEKYRVLSESLDARVKAQIVDIENKQKLLYQSERQSAVGRLAAGVAHEINNPMGFILSNLNTSRIYVQHLETLADLFEKNSDLNALHDFWKSSELAYDIEDFSDLVNESIQGGERIKAIVSALMVFSDVYSGGLEKVSVASVMTEIISHIKIPDNKEIEFNYHIEEGLEFFCNKDSVMQIILNVVNNSVTAIKSTGIINLSANMMNNNLEIMIEDTGQGMSNDVISRACDPFYTTCEIGKGVGLGLTVSKELISSIGGAIFLCSEPGSGTHVKLTFPDDNVVTT